MIHGQKCHIKELVRRFLAMNPSDMEYVYLLIKDKPNVKEAYEEVKRQRQCKTALHGEKQCMTSQNGVT